MKNIRLLVSVVVLGAALCSAQARRKVIINEDC